MDIALHDPPARRALIKIVIKENGASGIERGIPVQCEGQVHVAPGSSPHLGLRRSSGIIRRAKFAFQSAHWLTGANRHCVVSGLLGGMVQGHHSARRDMSILRPVPFRDLHTRQADSRNGLPAGEFSIPPIQEEQLSVGRLRHGIIGLGQLLKERDVAFIRLVKMLRGGSLLGRELP